MAGGIVIVGGGLAGARAAQTLRKQGYEGGVSIVCGEPHRPYERPLLSKEYLLGTKERDQAFVHPQEWYGQNGVDLILGQRAVSLDLADKDVVLADGTVLGFDKALLATGSTPRRLTAPGGDLAGIHYLRTLEDADSLLAHLGRASAVAVVGGGWIGLEVAAAARNAGLPVTVLEAGDLPLGRVLGPEMARFYTDTHLANGVEVRTRAGVAGFRGEGGAVVAVDLADGGSVAADLVVVGVGATPVTDLARAAGIAVDDGVTVDRHLRSSHPDVYAAGDIANAYHPVLGRHIRVEHWGTALRQGPVAARAMLGQDVSFTRIPYFYSDQYDLGMEYTGYVEPGGYDRVVVRGDVGERAFIAFWVKGARVLAGMSVNVWDVAEPIEAIVKAGRDVDLTRLTDPDVPLDSFH